MNCSNQLQITFKETCNDKGETNIISGAGGNGQSKGMKFHAHKTVIMAVINK